MATKEKNAKPNDPPEEENSGFDDSEFFKSEGVDDPEEQEAIRSRARVHRYAAWRATQEADPKSKKKKSKPWFKGDD
jgi:hypothetical protein